MGQTFMACSASDASSSDMPPERNVMPGTAGGTVRESVRTVRTATSVMSALVPQASPERTMLGLRSVPSRRTWWSLSFL